MFSLAFGESVCDEKFLHFQSLWSCLLKIINCMVLTKCNAVFIISGGEQRNYKLIYGVLLNLGIQGTKSAFIGLQAGQLTPAVLLFTVTDSFRLLSKTIFSNFGS